MAAMMKRLVIFLSVFSILAWGTACTKSEKTDDGEVAEGTEEAADGDAADDAVAEESTEETTEESSDSEVAAEDGATSDESSGDSTGELSDDEEIVADLGDESSSTDTSATDSTSTDTATGDSIMPESGTDTTAIADGTTPPETIPEPGGSSLDAMGGAPIGDTAISEPKPNIPLQKIPAAPFYVNGVLANAVYLAREGDTLASISEKVLGKKDRAALAKANPRLAKRDLRVGDKVYYNSPQRPDDKDRMLTYYEDAGLNPESYVSQAGDNIRDVSKRLLGHQDSWKEVWSTNMGVESKGEIPEGTTLKYWSSTDVAAAPPAAPTDTATAGTTGEMPPPAPADPGMDVAGGAPPPPPMEPPPPDPGLQAQNDIPPPPAQGSIDAPPPPPPPPPADHASDMGDTSGENPDQTMALAGGAVLILASLLLFIMIRKRRARRSLDFATSTQTQID